MFPEFQGTAFLSKTEIHFVVTRCQCKRNILQKTFPENLTMFIQKIPKLGFKKQQFPVLTTKHMLSSMCIEKRQTKNNQTKHIDNEILLQSTLLFFFLLLPSAIFFQKNMQTICIFTRLHTVVIARKVQTRRQRKLKTEKSTK